MSPRRGSTPSQTDWLTVSRNVTRTRTWWDLSALHCGRFLQIHLIIFNLSVSVLLRVNELCHAFLRTSYRCSSTRRMQYFGMNKDRPLSCSNVIIEAERPCERFGCIKEIQMSVSVAYSSCTDGINNFGDFSFYINYFWIVCKCNSHKVSLQFNGKLYTFCFEELFYKHPYRVEKFGEKNCMFNAY
jgi:hypothetical protein